MKRLVIAAAASVWALAAQAAGWTVQPNIIDGKFDRCTAKSPDGNLGVLMFGSGAVSALYGDPQGGYAAGELAVDVDIDGARAFSQTPSRALTDKLILVTLGEGDEGLAQLQAHKTLKFTTAARSTSFDLSDADGALDQLKACVESNSAQ